MAHDISDVHELTAQISETSIEGAEKSSVLAGVVVVG
jgi:hypothetical protein